MNGYDFTMWSRTHNKENHGLLYDKWENGKNYILFRKFTYL